MGGRYAGSMDSNNNRQPRGRPRRSPENLRRHALRVAVSDLELEQITVRAKACGLSVAAYLRRCALVGSPVVQGLLDLLARLLAQFRGVANNINQASHRANLILAKDTPDPAAADAAQTEIVGTLGAVRTFAADMKPVVAGLTTGGEPASLNGHTGEPQK